MSNLSSGAAIYSGGRLSPALFLIKMKKRPHYCSLWWLCLFDCVGFAWGFGLSGGFCFYSFFGCGRLGVFFVFWINFKATVSSRSLVVWEMSYWICKVIQYSGVLPKYLAKRKAISTIIPPFPMMIERRAVWLSFSSFANFEGVELIIVHKVL